MTASWPPCSAARLHAVERADDLHLQVAREAQRASASIAAPVHDDGRRVVLRRGVARAADAVAERRAAARRRSRRRAPERPLPLSTKTLGLVARQLGTATWACFFACAAPRRLRFARRDRGGLAWRCIACESGFASRRTAATTSSTSSTAATRLATSVAVRQGRISASGACERRVHSATRFATRAASLLHPRPGQREAVVERRSRRASRARARSRATSSTERRTSPSRAASCRGSASTPGDARARRVQLERRSCRGRCRR